MKKVLIYLLVMIVFFVGCKQEDIVNYEEIWLKLDGVKPSTACGEAFITWNDNENFHFQGHLYFGEDLTQYPDGSCDADNFIRLDLWNQSVNMVQNVILPMQISKTYAVMLYNGEQYQTVTGTSGSIIIRKFDRTKRTFDYELDNVIFKSFAKPNIVATGRFVGTWEE